MIGLIDNEFGKEGPITVTRAKVHDYLGMTLNYTKKEKGKNQDARQCCENDQRPS
jgi:hypothetical protein